MNHFEKMESYIPIELFSLNGFILANLVISFFVILRYFGLVYLFYAPFWHKNSKRERLHDQKTKPGQIGFEIKWSMISSLIFSFSGYVMGLLWQKGYTQLYLPFDEYGLWYLPVSFVVYSLIHEVYFYYTHLWMHRPKLYKRVHAVHHFSVHTSPWASFSFHPYEALVHAAFLPILVCIIPIHPVVVIAYLTFMTLTAISNHLGVEIIGSTFLKKHFISGAHHSIHHLRFHGNYGLYYCFMDRLGKTEIHK